MERFDVAAWARGPRRRRVVKARPVQPSVALEQELHRAARRIFAEAKQAMKADLVRVAGDYAGRFRDRDRFSFEEVLGRFSDLFGTLMAAASNSIRAAYRRAEEKHRTSWIGSINRALGIDIATVVRRDDVADYVDAAMTRSVGLITGLTDTVQSRVKTTLLREITAGASTAQIARSLDREFEFGRRRSAFIARDQAATFNGELTRARQVQAGIAEYEWSTSLDERVRPDHAAREGRTFRWDRPPADGHPGVPINCRCTAIPVIRPEEETPRPRR